MTLCMPTSEIIGKAVISGSCEGLMLADGETEAEGETDGLALALGLTDGLADGETEELGLTLGEIEAHQGSGEQSQESSCGNPSSDSRGSGRFRQPRYVRN